MKKFKQLLLILILCCNIGIADSAPVPETKNTYNVKIHDITSVPIKQSQTIQQEITQPLPINQKQTEKVPEQNVKPDNITQLETRDIREQAKFLYNTNNLSEALALFENIKETDKLSEDWLLMANICQDLQKTDDAVFYLKKAIASDDKNYKAHYNLGNIYFEEKQYNEAIKEYNQTLKIKKDFAYAHYNKGCCFLAKKSLINARYEFGLAIKSNPDEPQFYYNLAYTNKLMNKPKKAQEALEIYNQLISQ